MKVQTQEQLKEQIRLEVLAEMKAEAEAQAIANAEAEAAKAAAKAKKSQFTTAIEEEEKNVLTLKAIDIDKFKMGERSNEVTNYVRKVLILKALQQSHDLTAGKWYMTGNTLANLMNSIKMFTNRASDYKHLITSMEIIFDAGHNCWALSYTLNEESITNSYRRFLNTTYELNIPETSSDDRLKEIDNAILNANYNPVDLENMNDHGETSNTPKVKIKK